jgi:hypothetical protein
MAMLFAGLQLVPVALGVQKNLLHMLRKLQVKGLPLLLKNMA